MMSIGAARAGSGTRTAHHRWPRWSVDQVLPHGATRTLLSLVVLGFAVVGGFGALVPTTASAQASPGLSAELVVVLGKTTPGDSDPRLAAYPSLAGPQFQRFKTRTLLDQVRLTLVPNKPVTTKLPNGGKVTLTILANLPDGAARLRLEVTKADGKTKLASLTAKLGPEVPFFIAGQQHAGGTLVLGVTLKAEKG